MDTNCQAGMNELEQSIDFFINAVAAFMARLMVKRRETRRAQLREQLRAAFEEEGMGFVEELMQ